MTKAEALIKMLQEKDIDGLFEEALGQRCMFCAYFGRSCSHHVGWTCKGGIYKFLFENDDGYEGRALIRKACGLSEGEKI